MTNAERLRQRNAARGPVIGRTVVLCHGCTRTRWYGIGPCTHCGARIPDVKLP